MIREGDKLYIITRRDMSIGSQAVQSIHAMTEFTHQHPNIESEWYVNSNYLALLAVDNEEQLTQLLSTAKIQGIRAASFCEPDIGYQITAIALEPGIKARKLCAGIGLMR